MFPMIVLDDNVTSQNIIQPDSLISYILVSFYMVLVVLCHGIFSSRLQITGSSSLEQIQNQWEIPLERTSVWRFQIIQECILKTHSEFTSVYLSVYQNIRVKIEFFAKSTVYFRSELFQV